MDLGLFAGWDWGGCCCVVESSWMLPGLGLRYRRGSGRMAHVVVCWPRENEPWLAEAVRKRVLELVLETSAEMWVRMQAEDDLWEAHQQVA